MKLSSNKTTMALLQSFGVAHKSLELNKHSLACIKLIQERLKNKTKLNLHQTIQE